MDEYRRRSTLTVAIVVLIMSTTWLVVSPDGDPVGTVMAARAIEYKTSSQVFEPTATPEPERPTTGTAILSYYRPEWGGTNCAQFVNGQCLSKMASGLRWQDHYGKAAACPKDMPFWTKIIFPDGEEFACLDRGGAIVRNPDGSFWLDLLREFPKYPFGTRVEVEIAYPE